MLILRTLRRLRVAWSFLGLCNDVDPDTGRQCHVGPGLAWDLACTYHPGPREEARRRAETREAIEWAIAMRRRIEENDS